MNRILRAHALCALAIVLFTAPRASSVAVEDAEHLIVTSSALVSNFQVLAIHRTNAGIASAVVSMSDVLADAVAGRDDAETLRNYIGALHALGNLKFVLLGGDGSVVPVRLVRSAFYPSGVGSDFASDLYYAGLAGNWDWDADDIFGESYVSSSDPGDYADLDPDLAVGRAPVSDATQADRFVAGVIGYDSATSSSHFASALMLAEVLFPADWGGEPISLDGAFFTEAYAAQLLTHPYPMTSTRLYENYTAYPGSGQLMSTSAATAIGSGNHGSIVYVGHGDGTQLSMGSGVFDFAAADALNNAPNFHALFALSGGSCDPTSDCIGRHLLLAPAGGSAAVLGFSAVVFPSTASSYFQDLFAGLTVQSAVTLGDAWRSTLTIRSANTFFETSSRWTSLSITLFADPAMPFRSEAEPVPNDVMSFSGLRALFGRGGND